MSIFLTLLAACGVETPVDPDREEESGNDETDSVSGDTAPTDTSETGDTDTSTTIPPTAAEIAAANDKDGDYFLDENILQDDLNAILQSNDAELLRTYHYNTTSGEFYFDCDDTDAVQNAWQRNNGVDTNCDGDVNPTDDDALIIDVGYYDNVQGGQAKVFGDFDGDGKQDLAIGSGWEGAVYVFLGKSGLISHPGYLNAQADADAVFLDTTSTGTGFGSALKKADLNGDRKDDLIVGASSLNSLGAGDDTNSGGGVTIYGRTSFTDVTFDNSNLMDSTWLGAQQMFTIKGWTNASAGDFVHLLGDIDGKGNQQIVMGEGQHCYSIPALAYTGVQQIDSLYIYYSTGAGALSGVPNWDADGNGVSDYGTHYFNNTDGSPDGGNFCSNMVSADITGDSIDELVVADNFDRQHDGRGNVIISEGGTLPFQVNFFSPTFPVFYERGNGPSYGAGDVLGFNDIDGDGYPDLIVSVPNESAGSGTIYVTPGLSLASIFNGTNTDFPVGSVAILDGDVATLRGVKIYETTSQPAGFGQFASNSDSNGDSIDDLTASAGAYSVDGIVQGRAYYFSNVSLSTITQSGTEHLTEEESSISTDDADQIIASAESTGLGDYLVGGGDLDGDGTDEVAISDLTWPDRQAKGRVYTYFGGVSE